MTKILKIRLVKLSDLTSCWEHEGRHRSESGKNGNVVFYPTDDSSRVELDSFKVLNSNRWSAALTDIGWERRWALFDGDTVVGQLKLGHQSPHATSLHRATLSLGIESNYHHQGFGQQLIRKAIDWAKMQESLYWLDLFVFTHNQRALGLYEKFGFMPVGVIEDMFRVHGQKISDVIMTLSLR